MAETAATTTTVWCGGRDGGKDLDSEFFPGDSLSQIVPGVVRAEAPKPTDPRAAVHYAAGAGPWYTTAPDAEVPPRLSAAGLASCPPATLGGLLAATAAAKGGRAALLAERPLPAVTDGAVPPPLPRGAWATWTFADYLRDARRAARAFIALGLRHHESVSIWGFNAPEWHLSALAATMAGGKCAGVYPSDAPEVVAYKAVHGCSAVIVVDDRRKIAPLVGALSVRGDCRRLRAMAAWGFEPAAEETVAVAGVGDVPLLSWQALLELGDARGSDEKLGHREAKIRPGHCAVLVYTSGTTGSPKAVMASHDQVIFATVSLVALVRASKGFGMSAADEERLISYLPLSHIAGFLMDVGIPLVVGATQPGSAATFFARPYDLKQKALVQRLSVVRPTLFLGVPLVWEKLADKVRSLSSAAIASPMQKRIAGMAEALGRQAARRMCLGGDGGVPWGHAIADRAVLSKVRAALGLDALKYAWTAAAPIRRDTCELFGTFGVHLNEGYGMSECAGACMLSADEAHEWGSIGFEIPGYEVRVFHVDPLDVNKKVECPRAPDLESTDEAFQGEICFRGRSIMMGYMACPDFGPEHKAEIEQKTAEIIDAEGWLHSGDKGFMTGRGMVKITGRYKELIIGAGGENIAPVPIEDCVKRACDGICDIMLVGDKQKYNIALVTLKAVGATGEVEGTDELDAGARLVNPQVSTIQEAVDDRVWIDAIASAIAKANEDGKVCINSAFTIQKFTILPTNFSEAGGELTPSKKLKRKAVEARFGEIIDRVYATAGTYVRYAAPTTAVGA